MHVQRVLYTKQPKRTTWLRMQGLTRARGHRVRTVTGSVARALAANRNEIDERNGSGSPGATNAATGAPVANTPKRTIAFPVRPLHGA